MRMGLSVPLVGSAVTLAVGLGAALAKDIAVIEKPFRGLWVTTSKQCKGDPMAVNEPWLKIGSKTIETSGMDCKLVQFVHHGMGVGFIDTKCTVEESSGEEIRFHFEVLKPGKTAKFAEDADYGVNWYPKALNKCAGK